MIFIFMFLRRKYVFKFHKYFLGTYIPRIEAEVISTVRAEVIKPNEALKLRAIRSTVDRDGKNRVAGEEWLVRRSGDYLPGAYEEVVERCSATVRNFLLYQSNVLEIVVLLPIFEELIQCH